MPTYAAAPVLLVQILGCIVVLEFVPSSSNIWSDISDQPRMSDVQP